MTEIEPKTIADKKDRFLEMITDGSTFDNACSSIGEKRWKVYIWIQRDKDFKAKYESAKLSRDELAEDSLFMQVAKGKPLSTIFYLCNRRPDRWQNVAKVESKINDDNAKQFFDIIRKILERPKNGNGHKNGTNGGSAPATNGDKKE